MTALKVKGLTIRKLDSSPENIMLTGSDTTIQNDVQVSKMNTIKGIFQTMREFLIVGGDFAS